MRKLLIALAVLIVLFVVADRVSVAIAENEISDKVATTYGMADKPSVSIGGFPFITQVVAGDFSDISISASQVRSSGATLHDLNASFMGVHAALSQVLGGDTSGIVADHATGTAVVPYAEVEQRLPAGLRLKPSGNDLIVKGRLDDHGVVIPLRATVALSVAHSQLVVRPVHVDASGTALPVSAYLPQSSFAVPLSTLPLHLRLAAVTVTASGLRIVVNATDVHFTQV